MESILILGKGLLTGFLVSLPPGIIMVLCIRRTMNKSLKSGLISGLGATVGNTVVATIAAFFLGIILPFVERNLHILKLLFGIFIIILGFYIFLKNHSSQIKTNDTNKKRGLWNDFISVFIITLANPGFIISFIAFFAFWGIRGDWINFLQGIWLLGGVFIGTAIWWTMVNLYINKLHKQFKLKYILYLHKISCIVVIILGIVLVINFLTN